MKLLPNTVALPEELERAGKIAYRALELALDVVQEGELLLEIAERIEKFVLSQGAAPAFPVNISVNEVAAHYSPRVDDEARVPPDSLVKVDVGVHVNGFIADAAVSIALDRQWENLIKASREALASALQRVRHAVPVNEVARAIEARIRSLGYNPVKNLTGHKIERYNLHAGKSVPNVPALEYSTVKMLTGEIYAIEPFATAGRGVVVERGPSHIYRVVSVKRIPGDSDLNALLEELWRRYKGLPFSERWLHREGFSLRDLQRLVEVGRVYHYPRLVEVSGGYVSQHEDTVVVSKDGCSPIVRVLELYHSAHKA